MTMRGDVVGRAAAGLVLLCACGSSGSAPRDAGPTWPPIALADLCPIFTQDLCTYLTRCGGVPYCDMSQCLAETDCYGLPALTQAAAAGAVVYDPAQVGDCNARFVSDPCNFALFFSVPDIFTVLSSCPGTLTPELKQGDACISDGECVAGLYCQKAASGDCPGACTPFAAAGKPCGLGIACASSLVCAGSEGSTVCQAPASVGSPCTGDDPGLGSPANCGPIIICIDDPQCKNDELWCDLTSHTCKAGVGVGAACGATSAGQVQCADGLWCTGSPGACAALGGAGAACSGGIGCQTGLHCPFSVTASASQCTPPAPAGSPCNASTDCAAGLICHDLVCSAPLALDAACTSSSDCQAGLSCAPSGQCLPSVCSGAACDDATSTCVLGNCQNGLCQDYGKVGAACATGTDCATGACIGGTCADTSLCANP
jgi:hypothetical protein